MTNNTLFVAHCNTIKVAWRGKFCEIDLTRFSREGSEVTIDQTTPSYLDPALRSPLKQGQ